LLEEASDHVNAIRVLETIWQDTLYAARAMRKNPVFAATAVLILALGIGGNTAMFTVIRAVLLKPLDYRDPDKLVRISGGATPTRFQEMKAGAHSFSGIAAFTGQESLTLAGGAEPEVVNGVRVSAGFLRILGIHPMLGRGFLSAEDSPGGTPVVMISAELWRRRFDADPQIAGKTAIFAATLYTVIGVLPPRFQFPFAGVDVWMTRPSEWPLVPPKSRLLSPFLTIFGRLKPGLNLEQASAEMAVVHHQYALAHPAMLDAKPKSPVELRQMKDQLVASVRSMLWMLFGAVGFVLLIACANVASLLLARATSRSREFAVRSALGAARTRLVGQLLTESVLLSCTGGAIGVLLAAWSLKAIPMMTAFDLPRAGEIHLDWMVLVFAAALSVGTGMLFGLAPSLGASQPDLIRVLRGSGEATGKGAPGRVLTGFSSRGLLVVGQVALSVVLLIGATLLMESVAYLRSVDVGFNPANLLTMRVSLPLSRYDTDRKKTLFFQELVQRLESSPGVRGAAATMFLPMTGYVGSPVQDAGKMPLKLNERPIATILTATPDYFRTLEIPMRRGRDFTEQDKDGAQRVAIIDEALARRFWPGYPSGQDPIGQRLLIGGVNAQPAQIIGIVATVHQNLENTAWPETVYISFAQDPQPSAMLAIRTEGDPLRFTSAVREQVRAMDRDQPISAVRTMDELVDAEVGQRHLIVMLLGTFAGVALLLALIGIYGVISYSVTQRVHELGIRWALGAGQADILRLVMGQGLGLTLAGVAIGIGGALALTRVMKSLLFHVSATDPATFAGIGLLFVLAALAATYIPARRATRIDPMAALRI
jgi:putative ABC transport system permease protein